MWTYITQHIGVILQILYAATAAGIALLIIFENRKPSKAISWVIILVLLPVVGIVIYIIFGEDWRHKTLIHRKRRRKLNQLALQNHTLTESDTVPVQYRTLPAMLRQSFDAPLFGDNSLTFYNNGPDKFEALFAAIEGARVFIHLQYYIFLDDKIGKRLQQALVEKARQGVEVRVLYDYVGSWQTKNRFFKQMRKAGVEAVPFMRVRFPLLTSRVNYRNHRKVVVIDGKTGFMGGMNIADRYMEGVHNGVWRDNHFRVQGKAVYGLENSFAIDWFAARKQFLSGAKYYPSLPQQMGNTALQLVTSGPMGRFKGILQGIVQAIYNAKEYVYIQTPYFIPPDELLLAIQTAAMSGVDVQLMLPKKSDTFFVHFAGMGYLRDVLDAKVKVRFFNSGFIHSKLMVIDDSLVITGSANMDVRSFEHNFEIDAFIYCPETARQVKSIFLADLEHCEPVISAQWRKRAIGRKMFESLMRLFTPLL